MEIDYALLADSAQITNGKTYILGGGISIVGVQNFPAPIPFMLVVQLKYERTEADATHQIRIVVMDADGNPLLPDINGEAHFGVPDRKMPQGVPLVAPIAIGFPPMPVIQREGSYQVQILVDKRHLTTLPFAVMRVDPPKRPALKAE